MNIFRTIVSSGATSGAPPTATTPGAGTVAAADNPPRPSRSIVIFCYAFIAIAAVVAWCVNKKMSPAPPSVPEGLSVLVLLYVFAQVVERLLEPAVRMSVPDTVTKDRDAKVAEAVKAPSDEPKAKEAANAQRAVETQRANVSTVVWAVATVLGMLLSAVTGAYLLMSLGVNGLDDKPWIDVLVTGLAIGAGTKPVHDLITRIDAAKNAAKDPPETR